MLFFRKNKKTKIERYEKKNRKNPVSESIRKFGMKVIKENNIEFPNDLQDGESKRIWKNIRGDMWLYVRRYGKSTFFILYQLDPDEVMWELCSSDI